MRLSCTKLKSPLFLSSLLVSKILQRILQPDSLYLSLSGFINLVEYLFLEYTKTVESAFRALWLATQSRDIQYYSLIHVQQATPNSCKLRTTWFTGLLLKQRNFTNNQSLTGKVLSVWIEFIHETGENVFCWQIQIKSCDS